MKRFEGSEVRRRVDMLMEQISPQPGDVYLHQDIAQMSDCQRDTPRYRAVVQSWRKRLIREWNVDIDVVFGHGYRVLNENERVDVGIKDFGHARKRMGKSVNRIERADVAQLDERHLKQHDHAKRLRELVDSTRTAEKQIAIINKVAALPRKC